MRKSLILAIMATLMASTPAWSQQALSPLDAECSPEFYDDAVEAARLAEERGLQDAMAMDTYYRQIKKGPENDLGKSLACIDVAWPDLPFSSGFSAFVSSFIEDVADQAVESACDQARDKFREAGSVFGSRDFSAPQLPSISGLISGQLGQAGSQIGSQIGNQIGGNTGGQIGGQIGGNVGGGLIPPTGPAPVQPGPPKAAPVQSIGDLLRPRTPPAGAPAPTNPQPPAGGPEG
jgi:hypothetical protein